jgi:hypothetical protein
LGPLLVIMMERWDPKAMVMVAKTGEFHVGFGDVI